MTRADLYCNLKNLNNPYKKGSGSIKCNKHGFQILLLLKRTGYLKEVSKIETGALVSVDLTKSLKLNKLTNISVGFKDVLKLPEKTVISTNKGILLAKDVQNNKELRTGGFIIGEVIC